MWKRLEHRQQARTMITISLKLPSHHAANFATIIFIAGMTVLSASHIMVH